MVEVDVTNLLMLLETNLEQKTVAENESLRLANPKHVALEGQKLLVFFHLILLRKLKTGLI